MHAARATGRKATKVIPGTRQAATTAIFLIIGNPVSVHRAIKTLKAYDGIVEQASEQELAEGAKAGCPISKLLNAEISLEWRLL